MFRTRPAMWLAGLLLTGLLALSNANGVAGQDPPKDTPKDTPKEEPKKTDPPMKLKGFLPMHWGKLGLSDDQKQTVYKIQAKYAAEIDKLEAKIKEIKASRDKEMKAVLTPEQRKRLEDILLGKDN